MICINESNKRLFKLLKDRENLFKLYSSHCNMGEGEHWALYTIYDGFINNQFYSQKNLCYLASFPKQTINYAIKKLLEKEYIYFEKVKGTRREKIIKLTLKGKEISKEMMTPLIQAENKAIESFSESEQELFLELFNRWYQYLQVNINSIYKD